MSRGQSSLFKTPPVGSMVLNPWEGELTSFFSLQRHMHKKQGSPLTLKTNSFIACSDQVQAEER